ncbi:hypothetical protein LINPERPRIM_LOCUS31920 [Linum perenne]
MVLTLQTSPHLYPPPFSVSSLHSSPTLLSSPQPFSPSPALLRRTHNGSRWSQSPSCEHQNQEQATQEIRRHQKKIGGATQEVTRRRRRRRSGDEGEEAEEANTGRRRDGGGSVASEDGGLYIASELNLDESGDFKWLIWAGKKIVLHINRETWWCKHVTNIRCKLIIVWEKCVRKFHKMHVGTPLPMCSL